MDGIPQGHRLQPLKAGVVLPFDGVFVGLVIEDRLHLPQVEGGGNHVVEVSSRTQHPGKLLGTQGGEDVKEQVHALVGHRQVVHRGHGKFALFDPFGGPAQGKFGDVYSGDGTGAALLSKTSGQGGGVVPFAAAAVQQGGVGDAIPGG